MTQPNDFATRLESLTASIVTEPDAFKRFALIQQRDALLANHALAIAGLVRAAEQSQKALDNHYYSQGREGTVKNTDIIDAEKAIRAALAALNAEDKP